MLFHSSTFIIPIINHYIHHQYYIYLSTFIFTTYTLHRVIKFIGRKIRFNKIIRSFKLKLSLNPTVIKLKGVVNSFHSYSKCNKDFTSVSNEKRTGKVYARNGKIIIKRATPYLLIANRLLDRTPIFNPTPTIFHPKSSTHQPPYVNINDVLFNKGDPSIKPGQEPTACPITKGRSIRNNVVFDTDSFKVGIDTCASKCMSYMPSDFIQSSLKPNTLSTKVKPYGKGPKLSISHVGTVKWKIQDDEGKVHNILIPNSFLVPEGRSRLLSPQHWGKEAIREGNCEDPDSTHSIQYHNRNVLVFGNQGQFKRTVYNDVSADVPYFYTATGCSNYKRYVKEVDKVHKNKIKALETVIYYSVTSEGNEPRTDEPNYSPISAIFNDEDINEFISQAESPNASLLSQEEEHMAATTDRGELLRWHHRLGHMSFDKLQCLAKANIIPKRLATVKKPKCVACIYGKMHRRPWRSKGDQRNIRKPTMPGECVSVDQMQSSCISFVGQLKGRLTNKRYKYATVSVDHYSRYKYIYLQATIILSETLDAKRAFEAHSRAMGVTVMNYHADNGRFADNAFINDAKYQGQTVSYCGVNAHWQNGIAEKAIRDLREGARTSLLHAIQRWPSAINVHLWPYALRYSMEVRNHTPAKDGGPSPRELYSQVEVASSLKNFHVFGCPVYALDNRLQAKQAVGSWIPRARLGINLGPSPRHARTVSMVLSMSTGLVSPQYHVKHDKFFETVDRRGDAPSAPWMTLSGLKNQRKTM